MPTEETLAALAFSSVTYKLVALATISAWRINVVDVGPRPPPDG
jgi:hypothetical protein